MGKTIGDHIPPNRLVFGSSKDVTAQIAKALGAAPKKRPKVKLQGQNFNLLNG